MVYSLALPVVYHPASIPPYIDKLFLVIASSIFVGKIHRDNMFKSFITLHKKFFLSIDQTKRFRCLQFSRFQSKGDN